MSDWSLEVSGSIAKLTLDCQNRKVNILSKETSTELAELLPQIKRDSKIKALLISSKKKRVFIAGADIAEIESIQNPSEGIAKARAGHQILNDLEDLPFPSVCLINGITLGGGLELALACSYRFVVPDDAARLGLPEVRLGIIPGFGGTVRLPRRVGLIKGLEMILAGKTVSPSGAYKIGLVDGVAPEKLLEETAISFLKKVKYQKHQHRPIRQTWINKLLERTPFGRAMIHKQSLKSIQKTTRGLYVGPLKALEVIFKHAGKARDKALEIEAEGFGEVVAKMQFPQLMHVFHLSERYKHEKWSEGTPQTIQKCGVLGAGVMGGGIAQVISQESIPVRLKDINNEALLLGLRSAQKIYHSAQKKRRITKAVASSKLGLIMPTLNYSGFKSCDLVIEAVLENMEVKKKVFQDLEKATRPDAILASNTSSLSITEMSSPLTDPSRAVGIHFFNPVHRMPLVEIIRGKHSSERAIQTAVTFARRLRKTPIVVNDSCGFLVNRILMPYLLEAGHLFQEGEALQRVDRVLLDFGMPMGAFLLMDEVGLDVGFKITQILEGVFGKRMHPPAILRELAEKKWYGAKSGKGFYLHEGYHHKPNTEVSPPTPDFKKHSSSEIIARCIVVMINEAARCLDEGVAREAADVDIGMIMGTGFPPFRGGLLRYADDWGIDEVYDTLIKYQETVDPERFKPAERLKEMKNSKRRFYK